MEIIANLQYKVIDAKKTYEVRHPVLRKNLPLSSCYMELDDDVSTIHLGGFIKKKNGSSIIYTNKSKIFKLSNP